MDEHSSEIKNTLSSLTDTNKVLFGTLVAERLLPNYLYFEQRAAWGDHKILHEAIIFLYQIVLNDLSFEEQEVKRYFAQVEAVTPHTEDFDDITVSFALDACTSVLSTLDYLLDRNNDHIVYVSTYAMDTVDAFIQEKENLDYNTDPLFENKIAADVLMIAERSKQTGDIARLQLLNNTTITPSLIGSFKSPNPIIDLSIFDN